MFFLGERSQEISGIVNIINQIAERTSVLALNASMQAVAAGDAGRGFAVVADEVKRLAENARQATQQISGLVNAIQADSTETMLAMNQTISQVVDISKLAERAGEQMIHTRDATDGLVNTVREISVTTMEQAKVSNVLMERAHQLEVVQQNHLGTIGRTEQRNHELAAIREELARHRAGFQTAELTARPRFYQSLPRIAANAVMVRSMRPHHTWSETPDEQPACHRKPIFT